MFSVVMSYYVIKFELDKSVEAVPECWVTIGDEGVTCAWPRVTGRKLVDTIRKSVLPGDDWKLFDVTVLRRCGMIIC